MDMFRVVPKIPNSNITWMPSLLKLHYIRRINIHLVSKREFLLCHYYYNHKTLLTCLIVMKGHINKIK